MTLQERSSAYFSYQRYSDAYINQCANPLSTLDRYQGLLGHKKPLSLPQFYQEMTQTVGFDRFQNIYENLKALRQRIPYLDQNGIPPDVFMFLHDRIKGQDELTARFGWSGMTSVQTALLIFSLTPDTAFDCCYDTVQSRLIATYPSLQSLFQGLDIPSDYLFEIIDQAVPYKERATLQDAIKAYGLTPTEYSILLLLARGKTNKQIEDAIHISRHTVLNHSTDLFGKLNLDRNKVSSRTEAAIVALQDGLYPYQQLSLLPEVALVDNIKKLNEREYEVLCLIAKGLENKEIAKALNISRHTVKNHITAILYILGCSNRTAATLIYFLDEMRKNEVPQVGGDSRVIFEEE
jgi:DNA-binding NarL/FixJ family response regulator